MISCKRTLRNVFFNLLIGDKLQTFYLVTGNESFIDNTKNYNFTRNVLLGTLHNDNN